MATTSPLSPTRRSTLRRHRERAVEDRAALYAILDEALICHLGVIADGAPVVLPTCFGRDADMLYLHGSSAAASLAHGAGAPVCVTATLLDGLVYARSVFSHSANYRSAVVHGRASLVDGTEAKLRALRAIVEHTTPGSWEHARQPSRKELAATSVLALELSEASVKVRGGPPGDEPADVASVPAWAGVLPLHSSFGPPSACPQLPEDTPVPPHVRGRVGRSGALPLTPP